MSRRATLLMLALLVAPATPAAAQDSQLWTTASATLKLSSRWRLSDELTARFSDKRDGLYDIESNTLLGYQIGKGVTLWGGYTHDQQYAAGHPTVLEQRAREQLTFDNVGRIGSGQLSARLRVEQRWRNGGDGTGWRVRPYARYSLPLHGKTALNLSNETFVNLNDNAFQRGGVERMRNLIAVATPLSKSLTVEAGYLNQYVFVRGGPDTMDHVAQVTLSLSR